MFVFFWQHCLLLPHHTSLIQIIHNSIPGHKIPATANLYYVITTHGHRIMPCHYLVVVTLQARNCIASFDPTAGVVAPLPVCLQGLGNRIQPKSEEKQLQSLKNYRDSENYEWLSVRNYNDVHVLLDMSTVLSLTWISLQAMWWSCL